MTWLATSCKTAGVDVDEDILHRWQNLPAVIAEKGIKVFSFNIERALMCYNIIKGGWQQITPTTYQEVADMKTPTIGAIGIYCTEEDVIQVVCEMITHAAIILNVGKNIRAEQVDPIAQIICNDPEFKRYSVADFRLAMTRGVTGRYGTTFDRFDIMIVSEWLQKYWEEKVAYAEDKHIALDHSGKNEPVSSTAIPFPEWFKTSLVHISRKKSGIKVQREFQPDEAILKVWRDEWERMGGEKPTFQNYVTMQSARMKKTYEAKEDTKPGYTFDESLPFDSVFTQPSMRDVFEGIDGFDNAIKFLVERLNVIAGFFGVKIPDIHSVAELIFDSHNNLSCLDIAFFTKKVINGDYTTEYQVMERGITVAMLTTWLDNYMHQRQQEFQKWKVEQELYTQPKTRLQQLEETANEIRANHQETSTILCMNEFWKKEQDGEMVACAEDDPDRKVKEITYYRKDKPKVTFMRLIHFLQNFVVNYAADGSIVGPDARKIADSLVMAWKAKFSETEYPFTVEDFCRIQANELIVKVTHDLEHLGPLQILCNGLAKRDGRAAFNYTSHVREWMEKMNLSWPDYLQTCIDKGIVPLTKDHYMIGQALHLCRFNGLQTPVMGMIDHVLLEDDKY